MRSLTASSIPAEPYLGGWVLIRESCCIDYCTGRGVRPPPPTGRIGKLPEDHHLSSTKIFNTLSHLSWRRSKLSGAGDILRCLRASRRRRWESSGEEMGKQF